MPKKAKRGTLTITFSLPTERKIPKREVELLVITKLNEMPLEPELYPNDFKLRRGSVDID